MHPLDVLDAQSFGINFSTTWSMVKLAALARGGNSLKLDSQFIRRGGAAYMRGAFSRNQLSYEKPSSPRSNGSARRSKNLGTRSGDKGSRQTSRPSLRCSA